MQGEWPGAAERFDALAVLEIAGIGRRHFFCVIGNVVSSPLLVVLIPPNKLLALTPELTIGTRRGAVVDDAAIVWPGKAPMVAEFALRISFQGTVVTFLRKNAAIDPRSAGGRSIVLEVFDLSELLTVR